LWWPPLLCRAIANEFHPTTHKVSLQTSKAIILPKTRASCYSHHLSQYALRETNWLFRASRCNPCLNPYILRHYHETLLKGSWNYVYYLRHHHELSPRGSWNYVHYLRYHHELSPRGSWNYVHYLRHHHELSPRGSWYYVHYTRHHHESYQKINGITFNSYHSHSSPTNHRFIMHTNLMHTFNQPSNHISYA